MQYAKLYGEQFPIVWNNPNATRSSALITPIHSAIADQCEQIGFRTKSLRNHEYEFVGYYGSKKCDIALFDEQGHLKGVILTKWIRSNYNKNANNFFENMRGESQLFIDSRVPVYQTIFIPTFERPTPKSTENYQIYINKFCPVNLKIGVWYMDVEEETGKTTYSNQKTISGVEPTLTEGINNFLKGLK